MLKHLAIIIVGKQNSGKTTRLRDFCNTYDYKSVSTFKQGWRYGITPFKENYYGVKIVSYFLPSSRSERAKSLKDTFNELEWQPDFLFMAEQQDGVEYERTIHFLRQKRYHIKEFLLDENNPDSIWHRYESKDAKLYLEQRTEAIADYVRNFILSRI
jgi:hypothetical protein